MIHPRKGSELIGLVSDGLTNPPEIKVNPGRELDEFRDGRLQRTKKVRFEDTNNKTTPLNGPGVLDVLHNALKGIN